MAHDLNYFASEIGKFRATAINRGWTAPPEINAQIYFRSSDDPRDVDVEAWASALHYIETHHKIPLTISGGGYACFAVTATSELSNAARFVSAVEKDMALQSHLDRIRAKVVEIWQYFGGKSSMEIVAPMRSYPCIVATNRKPNTALRAGDQVALGSFTKEEDELILGKLGLWVYDPRNTTTPPGVMNRLWRKFIGPPSALQQVVYSGLSVITPSELHEIAAKNQPDKQRLDFNIYVHGYATTFDSAVNTYGHFIHKVRYDQLTTTPILFCWPSSGKAIPYLKDTDIAQESEVALTQLIDLLSTKQAPAPTVDILAHSHGTKLTLRSLITPSSKSAPGAHPASIKNLIFVAPDMATGFFNKRFASAKQRARFITIYFSRGDIPLTIASWFQNARLGKLPDFPSSAIEDTDFIDASSLNAEWLGHSYHIGCKEMHEDIRGLLDGTPAQTRRLLIPQPKSDARIWTLLPDEK
jgi:esterase/lipase superfamily enzyme